MYIVRKFSKAKWTLLTEGSTSYKNLQADAVTSCLRTSSNTLSVWAVESTNWDEIKPVLAALFSSTDSPTRTDVIIMEKEVIENNIGIALRQSDGSTPATENVNKLHHDLINIDLCKIDAFANLMYQENIKTNNPLIRRFRESEVIDIVKSSIASNEIDPSKLRDGWQKATQ